MTYKKRLKSRILQRRDASVVGEIDGIGKVFRHVERFLAAFLRLPRIVDVVEFQLAATEFLQRRLCEIDKAKLKAADFSGNVDIAILQACNGIGDSYR